MKSALDELHRCLNGTADPETIERVSNAVDDPDSDLSQLFRGLRESLQARREAAKRQPEHRESVQVAKASVNHRRTFLSQRKRLVWFGGAIAASLLIGFVLRGAFPDTTESGMQVLAATGTVDYVAARGSSDRTPRINFESPFDGFGLVISLAKDRRPFVYPQLGQEDIEIKDGASSYLLPADTSEAVFVVTQTPAGESIRAIENTELRELATANTASIRNTLERHLRSKGHKKIAIGEVEIDQSPRD
jgi:hypothetical protein